MLAMLGSLCWGQEVAETRHLKLTVRASEHRVKPGSRVTLSLEVELKPRMHVYAPEVEESYIPINWTMAESPAWVAGEVSYPSSKKLHLAAINETVPVYEGNFRLVRELTLDRSLKRGELTVEGSFRYQACDDTLCYRPETIPLRWTFFIAPPGS